MKNEKACGAVIKNEEGKILLIFQQNGFWGFPKGHVEEGETEPETAVREVFEETGLWVESTIRASKNRTKKSLKWIGLIKMMLKNA